MTFVRCNSHRARSKLLTLIGQDSQCHFRWDDRSGQGIYLIPDSLLQRARAITGVTRLRNTHDVCKCISYS